MTKQYFLLITFSLVLTVGLFSCDSNNHYHSRWLSLKDSFRFENLKIITIDSTLQNYFFANQLEKYFHHTKFSNDDWISNGYLYSWQYQDSNFTIFTVLDQGFGECLEIKLLVFDRFDKLRSNIVVARSGSEPGEYSYLTQSDFKTFDTFFTLYTRTYSVDQLTLNKLSRSISDSMSVRNVIGRDGKIISVEIDSSIISHRYKNKDGYVTEKMLKPIR